MSTLAPPSREELQQALGPRAIARNTGWNVLGQAAPLLIAAFAIPPLIHRLGTDRFGVLTLAWALVGYFSLFDLGLGRALTKLISDKLACGKHDDIASAFWAGVIMMLAAGAVFGTAIWLSAHWIVHTVLRVPAGLSSETTRAMYPLAICIPVITTSTGLRGVLEAQHRFKLTNIIRVAMGAFNFLGPLITSVFVASIYPVVAALVVGRVVTGIIYFGLCLRTIASMRASMLPRRDDCRSLLGMGFWMTVSNVAGPVMVYLDRFLISAMLSVSLVAYYTTPFEVVTKFWIVPVAITSVLFPAFAALFVTDSAKLSETYARALRTMFVLLFPAIFLVVLFAPEALRLWLGGEFQQLSTPIARWIAVGVLVNSFAQVPYSLLQAVNRPDLTAKVHLFELPIYVGVVVTAIHFFGLAGAAMAWALRLVVEAIVLFALARRTVLLDGLHAPFFIAIMAALASLGAASLPMAAATKLGLAAGVLALFALLSWHALLRREEKAFLRIWLARPATARQ